MEGICLILLGFLFIIVGKSNRNNVSKNDDSEAYMRGYRDALNHQAGNDGEDNGSE